MKKTIAILTVALTAVLGQAQTVPISPQQSFFDTVTQYFSSMNSNLTTFTLGNHAELSLGFDTVGQDRLAASFLVEVPVWKAFSIEGNVRNATVLGDVVTAQGGIGYSVVKYDTKLTAFVDGGYRWDTKQSFVAPGVRVKKALTQNTYAGVGIELPFYVNGSNERIVPTYSIFTGFKF